MASTNTETEALERRMLVIGAGYAVVVTGLLSPYFGLDALSVCPGAGVGLLNTWLLGRGLRGLMTSRALGSFVFFLFAKLSVTGLFLYGLFRAGWVSTLPFVIGLGAIPVALSLAQLFQPRSEQSSPS